MKQSTSALQNKNISVQPDPEQICRDIDPIIHFCLRQYPTFLKNYEEEMYNTAVISVLEHYHLYDASKGNPTYFVKEIKGAINHFIAKNVYNFSSLDKYRDYLKIVNAFPMSGQVSLSDADYALIKQKTGLGHTCIDNAIQDACIAGLIKHSDISMIHDITGSYNFLENIETMELNVAIHTAMEGLDDDELDFIYDMCGFYGRTVLSEKSLRKKYHMSQDEYDRYLSSVIRKLKGSRKLRRYIGRKFLI